MKPLIKIFSFAITFIFIVHTTYLYTQELFTPKDLLELKYIGSMQISPDGNKLIYSISTPRNANEKPGSSNQTFYLMDIANGSSTKLFPDNINGSSPRWNQEGNYIAFLLSKNGATRQVFAMPANGGDIIQMTRAETNISSFRWNPDGNGLAYICLDQETEREKELKKRGYGFIFYEENLKNNNLFASTFDENFMHVETKQLTKDVNVWDFEFNHQGSQIVASISSKNLIDHMYMFRKIYVIDIESAKMEQISKHEGKLGNYAFSPDGKHLAYIGAMHINDHGTTQLYTVNLTNKTVINLTPKQFKGHMSWVNWKNNKELLFLSDEGVYPKLNTISLMGGERTIILNSEQKGVIFSAPNYTKDFKSFVFQGSTPYDPGNIYYWNGKKDFKKITNINPQLINKTFGKQDVINYTARDGLKIEGLLIKPVNYNEKSKYPLIVYVHGGPESYHSNRWLSSYSAPGQVMANKGYLVLYLNYRSSTGYGLDFAMEGFMDPAGKEFDDIADGIDYVIKEKGADRNRVGMAGGSYGGYASAWFATYYTDYVKAVCAFVGISNNISRKGTTDIPYEELYVHGGEKLEKIWQISLERSPIYWAHQSKTATLIYGGASDTRVHPSQSIELYRRMKMNDHPAVRLVQYPGEGHGNRMQVGRIDVLYRQIEWLDWYVKDLNPLNGPMPRLDISEQYGLDWEFK